MRLAVWLALLALLALATCAGPDYVEVTPSVTRTAPGGGTLTSLRSAPRAFDWDEDPGTAYGAALTFGWVIGEPRWPQEAWDAVLPPPPAQAAPQKPVKGPGGGLDVEDLSAIVVALVAAATAWWKRKMLGGLVQSAFGKKRPGVAEPPAGE